MKKLDQDEQALLNDYEDGLITTRTPLQSELDHIAQVAANTMRKNRRITIRLYEHDYTEIQKKAFELGMPYQTLISSMIHQFVEGELTSKS